MSLVLSEVLDISHQMCFFGAMFPEVKTPTQKAKRAKEMETTASRPVTLVELLGRN